MDELLDIFSSVEVEYNLPFLFAEDAINVVGDSGYGSASAASGPTSGYDKLLRPNNPFKRKTQQVRVHDPNNPIKQPRSGIKGIRGF